MSEISPNEWWVKASQEGKKSFDLSWLITDSHLSKVERDIIVDSYQKDKEKLFQATQSSLKSFIIRDYGAANMQSLGGFDGVVALQKALKVDPADGSFGPNTFQALIEYQKSNNLTIDGIAGTETIGKLGIVKASNIKTESLDKIDKKSWNGSPKRKEEKSTETVSIETVSIAPPMSMAPMIKKFTTFTNWVEEQIKSTNEHKKDNTGIVAGVGDWIGEKTGAFETGKSIYEQQIKQAQDRAKELHSQISIQFQWKNIPESEKAEVGKLIARLEKLAWAKLEEVSWWKAVFNTIGAGDIEWDAGSLKNRTKIFAKTTIGFAEGAYDVVSSIAEITGKAIGITAAYVGSSVSEGKFDSSVGKQITSDVKEIFSMLTIENAKIAIAKLPEALEKFANASPDIQAEGFGKFFGNLLVAGWVWVKIFQWGKHAMQLWNRAIRMANHRWLSKSAPLALAGALQLWSGTVAMWTGVALRIGEMDVIPGKKWAKKTVKAIEDIENTTIHAKKEAKSRLSQQKKPTLSKEDIKNGSTMDDGVFPEWNATSNKSEVLSKLETELSEKIKQLQEIQAQKIKQPLNFNLTKQEGQLTKEIGILEKRVRNQKATDLMMEQNAAREAVKEEFTLDGKNSEQILGHLRMKYHPDRTSHPRAKEITQELNNLAEIKWKVNIHSELEEIFKDADGYLDQKANKGASYRNKPKEKADFYTFKDGATVEKGSFDATGAGEGRIKRPDGSFHEGKFVWWELEQGMVIAKNGEKFIFNKNSKIPLMREVDNKTMGKIHNHESVRWEIPTMKWTHRTTADVLEQILRSGKIGTNADRWVNFWGGLGAGYGDISLIMKKDVQKIRGAKDIAWDKVTWTDNMVYFFWDQSKGNGMRMEEYSQKFGDFTNARVKRGENPHITDPYLMVWERGSQFTHEVDADMIEAVILPSHVKSYPNYPEIKAGLEARWIRIIEAKTSSYVLNYSGGSILNVIAGGRSNKWAYAELIRTELTKWYPDMPLEDAAIAHLKSTGAIPMDSRKTFQEHLEGYNRVANNDGLSRGEHTGWEFQNYASHKNHAAEQQSYFNYLVESKYRNFSEMPSWELSSLLEGYLTMPELLKQKWVSPKEIHWLLSALENTTASVDGIVTRNSSHRSILTRLAA